MKKKIIILILLVIISIVSYNYIYKEHRNIEKEKAEFSLTSKELSNEFLVAPSDSEKKYLNKTIEVSGVISEINETHLALNGSIFCQFINTIQKEANLNDSITVKGRCIGYDDLLEEIKLDQCTLANN